MEKEIVIKLEGVTKKYKLFDKPIDRLKESFHPLKKKYHKEFYALNDVNIEILKGETIGIIGKNGSGKSTLLKIITGVLSPTSGSTVVNGRISALLELGAGFNPELTGIENIYMNGTILGYSKKEIDAQLDSILQFAEIGEFVYKPMKLYSSGMFARLAFSVAIHVDPDILIVDEALAVGDTRFQIKCLDEFKKLRAKGKTILFVSHDINSIKRFCTSSIWINEGVVEKIGDTDEVTDLYLDYLKVEKNHPALNTNELINNYDGELVDSKVINDKQELIDENELNLVDIAEIFDIRLKNNNSQDAEIFNQNDQVTVEVEYLVNDKDQLIKNPVIGIAIRTMDDYYVCGLNTLLDDFSVNWIRGKNLCRLHYKNMNLIGGSYYLDIAIYDQSATVPIDYKSKAKTFRVKSRYTGEGIVVLDHIWEKGR